MKKIILIGLFSILLTSCASRYTVTAAIDYSRYLKSGFFITESNSVSFDYLPVGSVSTVHSAGSYNSPDNLYKVLDEFVMNCQAMDANAVINFKINFQYNGDKLVGYTITGMAIQGKTNSQ